MRLEDSLEKILIVDFGSQFTQLIARKIRELRIVMGNPTAETKDNKGARVLIYKNKKYGITCERKFELSDNNMIVGFSSKGCF